ncbi:unnamed protein product [Caretta caretta]
MFWAFSTYHISLSSKELNCISVNTRYLIRLLTKGLRHRRKFPHDSPDLHPQQKYERDSGLKILSTENHPRCIRAPPLRVFGPYRLFQGSVNKLDWTSPVMSDMNCIKLAWHWTKNIRTLAKSSKKPKRRC